MGQKLDTYDDSGNLVSSVDTRTFEEAKADKNDVINDLRELHLTDGMWLIGHFWATDARARTNITGCVASLIAGIPLPTDFSWRDNDNNNVPFSNEQLVALGGYIMAYVNQVYTYSWGLKASMETFTTNEEIDTFDVLSGWPDGDMDGTKPAE